jgi:hypothetical protein
LRSAPRECRPATNAPVERAQTEQDHGGVDKNAADAENRQIDGEAGSEIGYFLENFAEISHDAKTRDAIGGIQNHFRFNDEKFLAVQSRQSVAGIRELSKGACATGISGTRRPTREGD